MSASLMRLLGVWFFLLGLCVGSFLNVCIYRLPRDLSVRGRSFCPHCKHQIRSIDLIPLVSQIVLRARCRDCGRPISWRYFGVELLTGLTFLGLYALYAPQAAWLTLTAALIVFSALIVTFFADLETTIIPDQCWTIIAFVGIVYDLAQLRMGHRQGLWDIPLTANSHYVVAVPLSVVGFVVGGVGLYLFVRLADWFFRKETMGWGDVKFTAAAGTILGPGLALFVYLALAAMVGLVAAIPVVLWRKRKQARAAQKRPRSRRKAKAAQAEEEEPITLIPFGPFLALSLGLMMLLGDRIMPLMRSLYTPWQTGGPPWP